MHWGYQIGELPAVTWKKYTLQGLYYIVVVIRQRNSVLHITAQYSMIIITDVFVYYNVDISKVTIYFIVVFSFKTNRANVNPPLLIISQKCCIIISYVSATFQKSADQNFTNKHFLLSSPGLRLRSHPCNRSTVLKIKDQNKQRSQHSALHALFVMDPG